MAYTQVNTYGSSYKRLKAQSIMGIPAGPDLPTPDTEDGFCLFIQTDSYFANGKLKMWDGANWTDISDPDRYGETTSSVADAYEVIFDPELLAYNKGDVLKVKFNATNAGPATLAPNALPARTITLPGGSALSGGEIVSDGVYLLFVNDTNLQLISGGGTGNGILYAPATTVLTDNYQANMSPAQTAYTEGTAFLVKFDAANTTTTPTLAFNGLSGMTITDNVGGALAVGAIKTDGTYLMVVGATTIMLIAPVGGSGGGGGDMTKSVYDPTGINADSFDWNNFTNKPTIPTIDPNTTIQGNTFNGADQLVKLDGSGKLPAIDGSLLTGLPTEIIWLTDESFRPTVGVTDKAYVSKATGIIYRYDTVSGSYKIIGGGTGTPYLTFTGTDTYISTNSPAITAYPKALYGVFANANTGSSTVKIDSLSALPVKLNGQNLAANNILANSTKLLLLASDNSHYQLQAGFWEIPAVVSGEKVVTVKSNGLNADYNLLDANTASATTGAQLAGMDWSSGYVSRTGVYREERFYNGYLYICTGTNIWSRIPYDLIVKDYIIDDLDDSAGVKTSIQMTALYPNAVRPQVVYGVNGKYEYIGSNVWMYFENKIAV